MLCHLLQNNAILNFFNFFLRCAWATSKQVVWPVRKRRNLWQIPVLLLRRCKVVCACVCVCVCVCTHSLSLSHSQTHTHTHTHTHTFYLSISMHTHTHIYTFVYVCVCIYNVCIYVNMYLSTRISCTHIRTHPPTHKHTHPPTHITGCLPAHITTTCISTTVLAKVTGLFFFFGPKV